MLLHKKLASLYSGGNCLQPFLPIVRSLKIISFPSAILLEKILLPSLPLREEIVDKVLNIC